MFTGGMEPSEGCPQGTEDQRVGITTFTTMSLSNFMLLNPQNWTKELHHCDVPQGTARRNEASACFAISGHDR